MAKKPNLGQINSTVFTASQLNAAFTKIDNAFENTLSLDGSTPNAMGADLDMNGNDIINTGVYYGQSIDVEEAVIGGKLFTGSITWRSDWTTSTSYQNLDVVRYNGDLYICLDEHTSGVFATDLSSSKWELFVENSVGPEGPQGDPGDTGPAGQGVPTGGTAGQVLAKVDGTNYNTEWVDQTSIVGITGTKAQFDTAVTDGNFLYVGDVTSNATHTGDVTGSTALTIDPTAITGKSAVTAVGTDYVLISDTSDSGNLKKALVSDFAGGGGSSSYDMRFGFVATPIADQIIDTVMIGRDLTLPANMTGSLGMVVVDPTATFDMLLKDDGTTIGTISISTSGVFTFTTTSGTSKSIAAGSVLTLVAPTTPDSTIENMTMTILATED